MCFEINFSIEHQEINYLPTRAHAERITTPLWSRRCIFFFSFDIFNNLVIGNRYFPTPALNLIGQFRVLHFEIIIKISAKLSIIRLSNIIFLHQSEKTATISSSKKYLFTIIYWVVNYWKYLNTVYQFLWMLNPQTNLFIREVQKNLENKKKIFNYLCEKLNGGLVAISTSLLIFYLILTKKRKIVFQLEPVLTRYLTFASCYL